MREKNIAIIFAGGTGKRMSARSVPKQFMELHGKPIIIYTLELYDAHPEIDGIVVVCLESWIPHLESLLQRFDIRKVSAIVSGGATGQESIRRGVEKAAELYPPESIALIHDGVRPLFTAQLITDNLDCVRRNGCSVTVTPAIETILLKTETNEVHDILDRSRCYMARAPQCFRLGDVLAAHRKALEDEEDNFVDTASLMRYCGWNLFTVTGPAENIKITTPMDYYTFQALMDARENALYFGGDR